EAIRGRAGHAPDRPAGLPRSPPRAEGRGCQACRSAGAFAGSGRATIGAQAGTERVLRPELSVRDADLGCRRAPGRAVRRADDRVAHSEADLAFGKSAEEPKFDSRSGSCYKTASFRSPRPRQQPD